MLKGSSACSWIPRTTEITEEALIRRIKKATKVMNKRHRHEAPRHQDHEARLSANHAAPSRMDCGAQTEAPVDKQTQTDATSPRTNAIKVPATKKVPGPPARSTVEASSNSTSSGPAEAIPVNVSTPISSVREEVEKIKKPQRIMRKPPVPPVRHHDGCETPPVIYKSPPYWRSKADRSG